MDGPEFDGWEKRSGNSFMQEPVAWMYDHIIKDGHEKQVIFDMVDTCARNLESDNCINIRPLYASPPKREPSASAREMYQRGYADGFRAIEKAHGIGE